MYVAKDLRQAEPRAAAAAQLAEVLRRFPSGPPVGAPPDSVHLCCSCAMQDTAVSVRRVHVLMELVIAVI
jgi:hypothetical protein